MILRFLSSKNDTSLTKRESTMMSLVLDQWNWNVVNTCLYVYQAFQMVYIGDTEAFFIAVIVRC